MNSSKVMDRGLRTSTSAYHKDDCILSLYYHYYYYSQLSLIFVSWTYTLNTFLFNKTPCDRTI